MPRLCLIGALAALLWVAPFAAPADVSSHRHFTLQSIAPGVYAAIASDGYATSNAGVVDLGGATLVFDTFLVPEPAVDLRNAAEELLRQPVRYVADSHDHDDHVGGNEVFAGSATIIGTDAIRAGIAREERESIKAAKEQAPKLAQQARLSIAKHDRLEAPDELLFWATYYEAQAKFLPSLQITLPDLTFERRMTLHGTKRRAELIDIGRGHTASDVVLWLPDDRILFAGDLVFANAHPYLGDGFPEQWQEALRTLAGVGASKIVPGHGPVSDPSVLDQMSGYLRRMQALAAAVQPEDVKAGRLPPMPAEYGNWWLRRFYRPNLMFLVTRR